MATVNNKNGTSAADTIKVTESDLTVNAGSGNDKINLVSGSRNKIFGEAGNDTITVESGAGTGNKLYGDAGNDTINAKESSNSVTATAETERTQYMVAPAVILCTAVQAMTSCTVARVMIT